MQKKRKKTTNSVTCLPKIRKPDRISKQCLNKLYPFKKLNKL